MPASVPDVVQSLWILGWTNPAEWTSDCRTTCKCCSGSWESC